MMVMISFCSRQASRESCTALAVTVCSPAIPASKPLGRSAARRNTVTRPRQRVQRSPCTPAGLHPAGVPFSAAAVLLDHELVTSSTDDSRGPTDKQIGRTHSANVDELSDLVFALGVTITAITRHGDHPTR
jgi:hypothetical protein